MRIGFTGHQHLPTHLVAEVDRAIRAELMGAARLVGISCLAEGADRLFAANVLTLGGDLEAVIPSIDYERTFSRPSMRHYRELLACAGTVHRLGYEIGGGEAYLAAGKRVVDTSERLLAVWDGQQARGPGGTADVVSYAREHAVPVVVLWPA